jgi:hypothetical protein
MGYEGEAGRTWAEAIHLLEVDGSARTRWVHRAVNAATDPELARAAREGRLNHDPESADIALPFVYHDPALSHFILVVPEELRHTALDERSQLWDRIAGDTEAAVPRYVLDCPVVIGVAGLRARLGLDPSAITWAAKVERCASAPRPGPSEPRAPVEEARPVEPAALERCHAEMEASLRARDERLRRWAEELRAWEERLADLERSLEARRPGPMPIESETPISLSGLDLEPPLVEDGFGNPWEDDSGDVTGVRMTEPSPPLEARRAFGEAHDTLEHRRPPSARATESGPARALPAGLESKVPLALGEEGVPLVARLDRGEVLLFARLDDEARAALAKAPAELLVQLGGDERRPSVLLTVTAEDPDASWAIRAPLDVRDPDQRAILTRLATRYEALLVPVDGGAALAPIVIAAPREANVALLLERVARAPTSEIAPARDALTVAPPVRLSGGHPFVPLEPATSAREAFDRVHQLAAWAAPARMDLALLVLSIPRERVDRTMERVLADGRAFGIALPQELLGRCAAHGLMGAPRELVEALLAGFVPTAGLDDRGGLTLDEVASNWESLLELAARHGVEPSAEVDALAKAAIERLRRLADETTLDLETLGAMPTEQLVVLLEHPRAGAHAALTLLDRGDPAALAEIFAAVRRMTREDVLKVLPRLVAFGDAAADVLLEGLEARKTYVRQASAVGLARLGSARSVEPLLELLVRETSEVWREVARVLPALGAAAIEALARVADAGAGEDARVVFAFAHLAERGHADVVEAVAESATGRGSLLASRGITERARARAHTEEVKDEASLEAGDRVLRFSAQLERALDGALPSSLRAARESLRDQP